MDVGEFDDWGVRMVDRLSARCANGHEPMPGRDVPKYCTLCGAPMMVACPNGHVVKIGRFCSSCGATFPLLAVPGAAEPLTSNADVSADAGADSTALLEPTHHPPHRSRLVIAGVVLLVLLIGGGA